MKTVWATVGAFAVCAYSLAPWTVADVVRASLCVVTGLLLLAQLFWHEVLRGRIPLRQLWDYMVVAARTAKHIWSAPAYLWVTCIVVNLLCGIALRPWTLRMLVVSMFGVMVFTSTSVCVATQLATTDCAVYAFLGSVGVAWERLRHVVAERLEDDATPAMTPTSPSPPPASQRAVSGSSDSSVPSPRAFFQTT